MKTLLFLLLSTLVFGQSNLYWQIRNGSWLPSEQVSLPTENEFSVYEFNDDTWYLFTENSNVLISFNKLYTSAGFGDRLTNGPDFARIDDSLFVSLEDKIFRIKMPSYSVEAVSNFHVNRLLQVSENLVFGLTPDLKIYKSTDNLRHWVFVSDFEDIVSWVYDRDAVIYYTTPDNKLKKADLQFNSTLLTVSVETVELGKKLISPGKDTLFFLGKREFWKTTDGGATFEKSVRPLDLASNMLFYDKGNILTVTNEAINRSSDLGATWDFPYRDKGTHGFYDPFLYANDGVMLLKYHHEKYYDVIYDPDYVVPEYDDFFPLHVGNKWRYDTPLGAGSRMLEVTGEQTIDGKTWYTIAGRPDPVRYENNIFYRHDGTTSKVEIDFRFNPGNTVNTGYFIEPELMWSAERSFAGTNYYLQGPLKHRVNIDEVEMYAPGFGPMVINLGYPDGLGGYVDSYRRVFEAEIYQDGEMRYFSEVGIPLIEQVDINFNYPTAFDCKLKVLHPNRYKLGYTTVLSFISNVKIEYFYEKDGNVTAHDFYDLLLTSENDIYGGVFGLDDQYLNDGYKFRFRYVVEDASLKNNKTYLPANGYYQYDGTTLGVNDEIYSFQLNQNYPNPFNPVTKLSYSLEKQSRVVFEVCDIQGRKVSEWIQSNQPAGSYTREFDGSNLASGVYIARLRAVSQTGGEIFTKSIKMILMK